MDMPGVLQANIHQYPIQDTASECCDLQIHNVLQCHAGDGRQTVVVTFAAAGMAQAVGAHKDLHSRGCVMAFAITCAQLCVLNIILALGKQHDRAKSAAFA